MNSRIRCKSTFRTLFTACFILYSLLSLKVVYAAPDSDSSLSKVVITGYELDADEMLTAEEGEVSMILTLHIKNMDKSKAVKNLLITYTGQDNLVLPAEGKSNQEYVDSIKAGKSIDLDIPVRINMDSGKSSIAVNFDFEYVDVEAGAMKNSAIISISTKQDYQLEVSELHIPYQAAVNEKGFFNANLTNTGKKELYNIKMIISGDIKEKSMETTIVSLSSGDEKELQTYATFLNNGANKITICFQYEDNEGTVYTTTEQNYTVQVSDDTAASSSLIDEENSYTDIIMLSAIAAGVLVILLLAIHLWKRRR